MPESELPLNDLHSQALTCTMCMWTGRRDLVRNREVSALRNSQTDDLYLAFQGALPESGRALTGAPV